MTELWALAGRGVGSLGVHHRRAGADQAEADEGLPRAGPAAGAPGGSDRALPVSWPGAGAWALQHLLGVGGVSLPVPLDHLKSQ